MTAWRLAGIVLAGALAGYVVVASSGDNPATCALRRALPDDHCTPGARRAVNRTAVCRARATDPRVPESLAHEIYTSYGVARRARAAYPLDDLIPAELGGDGSKVHNLWPQPRRATPGPRDKARLERRLRSLVCQGRLSLAAAQNALASNWVAAWRRQRRSGGL
jgi:hypothetical protein